VLTATEGAREFAHIVRFRTLLFGYGRFRAVPRCDGSRPSPMTAGRALARRV